MKKLIVIVTAIVLSPIAIPYLGAVYWFMGTLERLEDIEMEREIKALRNE